MLSYGRKTLNSEKRMRKVGKRVQIKRLNSLINIITEIRLTITMFLGMEVLWEK